jgi:L-lactate dehydrogenase complex protein LldG
VEEPLSARDDILNGVRAAISNAGPPKNIPRDYRTSTEDGLETFFDRLAHYEAQTHQMPASDLDQTVRSILNDRKIVTPDGIPERWVENALSDDPPLDAHDLDAADGVVTTCALAIAQTGTIVLDGGSGMGRRALTLVPDYHLCVVKQHQIVSSVPEAITQLQDDPTRPLTFISGPSATVDIEMVRVRGVHGPRRLEVIVVTEPTPNPRHRLPPCAPR